MQTLQRSRPLGVTIITLILAVTAILTILFSILGIVGGAQIGGTRGTIFVIAFGISIFFAVVDLIIAWGPWAFWLTAITQGLQVLYGIYEVIALHSNFFTVVVGLAFPIIVLIYLFADRNVRAAFRT